LPGSDQYITIRLEPLGKELKVLAGTPLVDVLYEYGMEFPCGGKGKCGKCRVRLLKGEIPLSSEHRQYLSHLNLQVDYRLSCMSKVQEDMILGVDQFNIFILADESEFMFTPGAGYGIAIDLGTTTIVAQLLDLTNAWVLGVRTALNPQARYGADIISRISFTIEKNGLVQLQKLVHRVISDIILSLVKEYSVGISKIVIVGNAVMQHIFCGLDLKPLSVYPFESRARELLTMAASTINPQLDGNIPVTFLPSIGSFVGSDILAGIMAAGIHERIEYQALIDLGTNGEIAAGNRDGILVASTAAGPAFEGTNISMGMRAATGAVSSVWMEQGKIAYHVIGNEQARGICGSGLIDAVAVFLSNGLIDAGGQIASGKDRLSLGDRVSITQQDIREFQLAKAAIAAGMHILCKQLNITVEDISKVFIAGAFGNFISLSNAISLGLLEFPEGKIHKLGNSALIGAKMALFMEDLSCEHILDKTHHLSLESDPTFQDIFISKLMFPEQ
jgi:uncharacterized 2Fe-2S/4Fe-4S cluster protein (DUF4445 family)